MFKLLGGLWASVRAPHNLDKYKTRILERPQTQAVRFSQEIRKVQQTKFNSYDYR